MAYISKQGITEIRNELKRRFPRKEGWKFSVRNVNHSSVYCTIQMAPVRFTQGNYEQINQYRSEEYENPEILQDIIDICNGNFPESKNKNYDNSDVMTDYFDVGWYIHIQQGSWDKPFVDGYGTKAKLDLIDKCKN